MECKNDIHQPLTTPHSEEDGRFIRDYSLNFNPKMNRFLLIFIER